MYSIFRLAPVTPIEYEKYGKLRTIDDFKIHGLCVIEIVN